MTTPAVGMCSRLPTASLTSWPISITITFINPNLNQQLLYQPLWITINNDWPSLSINHHTIHRILIWLLTTLLTSTYHLINYINNPNHLIPTIPTTLSTTLLTSTYHLINYTNHSTTLSTTFLINSTITRPRTEAPWISPLRRGWAQGHPETMAAEAQRRGGGAGTRHVRGPAKLKWQAEGMMNGSMVINGNKL